MMSLVDTASLDSPGRRPVRGSQLAVGGGLSVETLAISLVLPDAPPASVALLAIGAFAFASLIARALASTGTGHSPQPRAAFASECRRLQHALEDFVERRGQDAPRRGRALFDPRTWRPRRAHWDAETERVYRKDLRSWVIRVFDRAEQLGVVSASSRPSVERPSVAELEHLPELFENAARLLEADS